MVAVSRLMPKGSEITVPMVYVRPVSGLTFGLPVSCSISSGKNAGDWRCQPSGPFGVLNVWVLNSEVMLPMIASHKACTLARFGLLATLPHGDNVVEEQGSSCGKETTCCVGPVYSSATFGARVAAWKPPRNDTESIGFQVSMAIQVLVLPAVLKSDQR